VIIEKIFNILNYLKVLIKIGTLKFATRNEIGLSHQHEKLQIIRLNTISRCDKHSNKKCTKTVITVRNIHYTRTKGGGS
jgi:hypothetical protein